MSPRACRLKLNCTTQRPAEPSGREFTRMKNPSRGRKCRTSSTRWIRTLAGDSQRLLQASINTFRAEERSDMTDERTGDHRMACLEIRGGNRRESYSVELPGLSAWISYAVFCLKKKKRQPGAGRSASAIACPGAPATPPRMGPSLRVACGQPSAHYAS